MKKLGLVGGIRGRISYPKKEEEEGKNEHGKLDERT